MTECRELADQLADFVGGDLPPPLAERVRRHLLACPACRREAGGFQRARAALQAAAAQGPTRVDESLFTGLQQSIVAATTGRDPAAEPLRRRHRLPGPWWWAAAAALLAFGVWFGMHSQRPLSVWHRSPTATPAARTLVVPWSGPRVDLQLLGDDHASAADGFGAGMRGRHQLRALVDEGILLPPVEPALPGGRSPGR